MAKKEIVIQRDNYLEMLKGFRDKNLIKVLTGVRRCGKSTVMQMFRDYLTEDAKQLFIFITLLLSITSIMGQQDNKKSLLFLDCGGGGLPQAYIQDSMPMIPLEAVFNIKSHSKSFDFSVKREGDKIILKNEDRVSLITGKYLKETENERIVVNLTSNTFKTLKNETHKFSRPPQSIDGNTYVPADFFLHTLGYWIVVDQYVRIENGAATCTDGDMTIFVERKTPIQIKLKVTKEEAEQMYRKVTNVERERHLWQYDITPANGISTRSPGNEIAVYMPEKTMHVWGTRKTVTDTGEVLNDSYYEEDVYQYYDGWTLWAQKSGKYEITVSNGVTAYKYIVYVI